MDEGEKSSMTQFRVDALNGIGFEWAKRKGDFSWNAKYNELCDYRREHGDANVPTKYDENKALGRWVSTQRSQYKAWMRNEKSHMTQGRYDKLKEIGFTFDMLPYTNRQCVEEAVEDAEEETTSDSSVGSVEEV